MLKICSTAAASFAAETSHSRWMEQASGRAPYLIEVFGPGELGDFLPGLGQVRAWGIAGDGDVSGAVVTGFAPAPDNVSVMLAAFRAGSSLRLTSLDSLMGMPRGCLVALEIRSLISSGPCQRIIDRGNVVLETRSLDAVNLGVQLVEHLVNGARVEVSVGSAQRRDSLFVESGENGNVTNFAWVPEGSNVSGWVRIDDWRR